MEAWAEVATVAALEQCTMEVEVPVVSTLVKIALLAVWLVEVVVAAELCRM